MAKRKQLFTGTVEDFKERYGSNIDILMLENERGAVLAASAFIEEDLEILLRKKFLNDKKAIKDAIEPLFSGLGPLSTFSAKIKLTYALGLIDSILYKDLEAIRSIRNEFAHTYSEATFGNQRVKDTLNIITNPIPRRKLNFLFWEFTCPKTKQKKKIPVDQYRFIMSASHLEFKLLNLFGADNKSDTQH